MAGHVRILVVLIVGLLPTPPALAQTVRFPSNVPFTDATAVSPPGSVMPGTGIAPIPGAAPSSTIYPSTGIQSIPGATGFGAPSYPAPGMGGTAPAVGASTPLGSPLGSPAGMPTAFDPYSAANPSAFPTYGNPGFGAAQPTSIPPGGGFGAPGYAPGAYPSSVYPNNVPNALYPGGAPGATPPGYGANPYGYNAPVDPWNPATWMNGMNQNGSLFTGPITPTVQRFCLGPRFREGWVAGSNSDNGLQIHDLDTSLAFQIPQFLGSTQPLYIIPSFSLHLWGGPNSSTGADLPANAYSAFVDTGWETDPNKILGVDLGARIGVFTDFDTFNSHSVRYMGKLLGKLRLTPTSLLRFGVLYIDRNDIKLIPAGGLLWQPSPNTRWDISFPEPKLSQYLTTLGTADMWWYLGGYYGGGSWTIRRADGSDDRIDINDLRVNVGFEWGKNEELRAGRRIAFLEVGFVFNRNIVYVVNPNEGIDLANSVVVRAGLAY